MTRKRSVRRVASWCALGLIACASIAACRTNAPAAPPRIPGVRLLLLVVIDQGGADVLSRARPMFRDGLRRLLQEGARFDSAFHEHAMPKTCPGHTTIATGTHPRTSGIVDNEWYDALVNRTVSCVEDPNVGRSPAHLLVTGIGDWIKRRDSTAKVVAVSAKDRAAIPMAGKTGDGAYWYRDHDGTFLSSRYYPNADPAWLRQFNATPYPDRYFGTTWSPLAVDPLASSAGAFLQLDLGNPRDRFPHTLGPPAVAPGPGFYKAFALSPFLDTATAKLAESAIAEERLGADAVVDLLAVSFSALDEVGHLYGPNSLEALDVLLRLDTTLGDLLRFAEARTGPGGLLVALSADHGVTPLPEYLVATGHAGAAREGPDDHACFRRAWERVEAELGRGRWLRTAGVLDRETLERNGIDEQAALERVRAALQECPTVAHVRTRTELNLRGSTTDAQTRLYRNSFHPARSPDFYVQRRPFVLWDAIRGTSHNSPYECDRQVPFILLGPGIEPRAIPDRVATVDLAPTLAALLGLPIEDRIDGVDRSALVLK